MNFDNVINAPCENPTSPAAKPHCGGTDTGGGDGDGGGGTDPRCSDPAFAQAHPEICFTSPRLIVKPEYVMREAGQSCQFKAFLWSNGTESELTEGVVWRTSNVGIALIGAGSGNAVAVAPGIVTISAEWGVLNAFAQLEVIAVGECANQGHSYVLLFDTSKSATMAFSSLYASRLAFAKETARNFIDTIDLEKDKVVVMTFNSGSTVVLEESDDADAIKAAIDSIVATTETTNLQAGLQGAYEVTVSARRVIACFTDGENKAGADPISYANSIRGATAIIEVIGLRASGQNFRRLESIADGGFFVNALPSNQDDVGGWFSGFKSYLCSGSCAPAGNVTVGVGQLNFSAFTNWNVTGGDVDLIGQNEGGPALYDFLPGNGLYLDLAGSAISQSNAPDLGILTTKQRFIWEEVTYTIQLRLAGNQREERSPEVITVTVYDKNDAVIKTQDFSITNFAADFATFEMTFTPTAGQAGGIGGYIQVNQKSIPTGFTGVFGALLDRVTILDDADLVIFDDNFDSENAQFIPPPCDPDTGYGYCYDYGCLEAPIPAQSSDPSPLSDIEGGSTAVTYTSTKSYTAVCANDSSKTATATETRTSDISQAAADSAATAAARASAEASLDCSRPLAVGEMIDYLPCLLGKTGYGATGLTPDDIWGSIEYQDNRVPNTTGIKTSTEVFLTVSAEATQSPFTDCVEIQDTERDLLMRRWYQALWGMLLIVKNLPVGTYALYVYAHGENDVDWSTVYAVTGTFDSEGNGSGGTTSYGTLPTVNGDVKPPWADGKQYVHFTFAIANDRPDLSIELALGDNPNELAFFNGFQIKRLS